MKDNLINRIKSYSKDKLVSIIDTSRNYIIPRNTLIGLASLFTFSYGNMAYSTDCGYDPTVNFPITTETLNQQRPAVAFGGVDSLVVWQDDSRALNWDIYGQIITNEGVSSGSEISIVSAPLHQSDVDVAFNGDNYLVVWMDSDDISYEDIQGRLVNASGTPIGEIIDISTAINLQRTPSVASDNTNYLVVWKDYRDNKSILGQLVNSNGSLVRGEILISMGGDQCNIAFDGTNYLVVWRASGDIHGQLVSKDGTLVGGDIAITSDINGQRYPAVTFNANNYFVVWEDDRNLSGLDKTTPCNFDIFGQILDTSGSLVGGNIAITSDINGQSKPCVSSDGNNYLVVWEDDRNVLPGLECTDDPTSSQYNYDIFGQLVAIDGSLINADFPISTDTKRQRYPAVTFDGINYLTVWDDYRSYDIYGQIITNNPILTICLYGKFGNCYDGIDNDNDGLIDWEDKKSCYTRGKFDPTKDEDMGDCCDEIDNDDDGVSDRRDADCFNESGEYDVYRDEVGVETNVPINGSGLVGLLIGLLGATRLRTRDEK